MRGERVVQYGFQGQAKRIDEVISPTPMTAKQIAQAARLPVRRVRSHLTYWIRHERFYGFANGRYYRLQRGPQPGPER